MVPWKSICLVVSVLHFQLTAADELFADHLCDDGVLVSGEDATGNLLVQKHAAAKKFRKSDEKLKPWERRNYLVATSHKGGSHLLRNVMRRTFDILGATFACTYSKRPDSAFTMTAIGGKNQCNVTKAPIRFANENSPGTIDEMRREGALRGVMIIRDPHDMLASAYVYHHRGMEPWSDVPPPNISKMGPEEGVIWLAYNMQEIVRNMTKAYLDNGDDVITVRYEDFTKSPAHFDANMAKVLDFLFGEEITEEQRRQILQDARLEDANGPYGLTRSMDAILAHQNPGETLKEPSATSEGNHSNDQNDEARAKAALNSPYMPEDIKYNYTVMRKILNYA